MPLRIPAVALTPEALKSVPEKFLIFYSNIVNGQLWCPDCVAVDDLVKKTFEPVTAPAGLIVYVGDRAEWKTPANPFRAAPWNIQSIPTIVRLKDGREDGRLVEEQITERSLKALLEGHSVASL